MGRGPVPPSHGLFKHREVAGMPSLWHQKHLSPDHISLCICSKAGLGVWIWIRGAPAHLRPAPSTSVSVCLCRKPQSPRSCRQGLPVLLTTGGYFKSKVTDLAFPMHRHSEVIPASVSSDVKWKQLSSHHVVDGKQGPRATRSGVRLTQPPGGGWELSTQLGCKPLSLSHLFIFLCNKVCKYRQRGWLQCFQEGSSSLGPPWVTGSSPTDPPGPTRPRLATTMAEGNVCFWSECHMIWGWQLAKGDVEFGNAHRLWEAAEAHPVLTPGILTALGCRVQAPPTKAGSEPKLSPHLGEGGASGRAGVGVVALVVRAEFRSTEQALSPALTSELKCLSVQWGSESLWKV